LLDAVRGLAIDHSSSDTAPRVTISIGIAARVPDGNVLPEQFLSRADQALYRAKAQVRDRWVVGIAPGA
jgi:diguanylate cyclase (GGDEF)-like protein